MSDVAEKIAILEASLAVVKANFETRLAVEKANFEARLAVEKANFEAILEARLAAEKIVNLEARLKEEYKAPTTIEGGQASTIGNYKCLIVFCSADVSSGAVLML